MSRNKRLMKANRQRTDREKLELFVNRVNELRNTRLAKIGFNIEYKLQGQQGQLVESELKQPAEADLKDYLMTFRHFISEREDVFLNHIFSICRRQLPSGGIKQNLAQACQFFEQVKLHSAASFRMNENEYTPLQVTNIYLNGKYFHNDLAYQQLLNNLPSCIADVFRFHFLNFVINTSRIILYVQIIVKHAFKENLFRFEVAF